MKIKLILITFFLLLTPVYNKGEMTKNPQIYNQDMYFCIPSDSHFFDNLLRLIGSIHYTNFEKTKKIAVFNLGLTKEQVKFLKTIEKVSVHNVELTHPDLLKYVKKNKTSKQVRGWYAWKPVVIKQALTMFPYVLYLDAGCCVLLPLEDMFGYIQAHDYLLIENCAKYTIGEHCTKYVYAHFSLSSPKNNWIKDAKPITAGIQGLSRAVYDSYVIPLYELTKDLKFFEDDGSAPLGFGLARHDQTLFSIQARLLGFETIPTYKNCQLSTQGKTFNIHISSQNSIENAHIVYHYKGKINFSSYLKFKK
ncbi:MAG: hypothetical protein V1646_05035 [bacterium]